MQVRRLAGIAVLLSGAAFLASCQDKAEKPVKPLVRVNTTEAAVSDYSPTLELTGVIAARTESNLAFRAGGRVAERFVDIGDHVQIDTVLARLDPEQQQSDLRAAQASLDAANARLTQDQATFERQKTLLAQGFTTRANFDQAEQAVRVSQGSLDVAKTRLQNARDAIGYTELRAGAAGVITASNVEAGQVVQAAQTAFTLAVDGERDAVFQVDEALIASLTRPPEVQISLLADPEVKARGVARELSPVIDPRTDTIRAKIGLINTPPQMTLGAAVTGSMPVRARKAILLPWEAMFSDNAKPAVWVVDPASKTVSLKPVDILSYDSGSVAVASGLETGEQVVTAGVQLLHPGQVVEIAQEAAR